MNYKKQYDLLIEKTKANIYKRGEYTEKHHIIPKCLGGMDNIENIVEMTAREHFVAHLLLSKIYPESGLVHAAWMMSNMKRYSSRNYKTLRKKHRTRMSERLSGRILSEETKEKIRTKSFERDYSYLTGVSKSEDHKKNWYESRKNGAGWKTSEKRKNELKVKMKGDGNPMFGKTHNEEARKKISEANKQKIECPHCNKTGGISIMKRWHFDKCKYK